MFFSQLLIHIHVTIICIICFRKVNGSITFNVTYWRCVDNGSLSQNEFNINSQSLVHLDHENQTLVVTYGNERSPKRQKLPLSLSFSISLIRSSEYLDMTSFLLYDYFSIVVCLPRGLWINKFELPPGLLQGINFILRTNDKNSAWKQSDRTTDGTNT